MIRSGQASRAPRRGRSWRTASFVFAFGLLGAGAAFAQPPAPPADVEVAEDATEAVEPAEATPTEAPTAMRAPEEPGVRVEEHKRWTGGSDSLASAVEAYNGTAGGKQVPLTVETVAAAIRRGFRDWNRTTTAPYDWVLRGEEAPRGGRISIIRLDPSSEVNGSKLFVEMKTPGAPTIFQFSIPEEESSAVPPGPTLAEAAEQFNRSYSNAVADGLPPVTEEEIRGSLQRFVREEPAKEMLAARAERALTDGRLTRESDGLRVVSLALRRGERGPSRRIIGVTLDGVLYPVRELGLSDATRDRIAAALEAASEDDALPVQTRMKLLRASVDPGALSAEQNAALFAEFVDGMRRELKVSRQADLARAGLEGDEPTEEQWAPVNEFYEEKDELVTTMAALGATAPDAEAAYFVAYFGGQFGPPFGPNGEFRAERTAAVRVLKETAGAADGVRALVGGLERPEPTLPEGVEFWPDDEERRAERRRLEDRQARAYDSLRTTVHVHRSAVDLLLDAVRSARPTTDALAEPLLDAAQAENPELRAAALEALAGID
ncbi:hypothetical protein [Alienimonas californiensis]|uniref:HEAT repeat domain-containing protein n=1 Tax=Alienimonas californiensis TaxID=2527989 RepID=A0A517P4P1_9PLAN|nr:hypothetical protein [Alienimonas californiensis]QDT14362.1 hypothetical protein CA12_04350 [Alienimonas californiensis]